MFALLSFDLRDEPEPVEILVEHEIAAEPGDAVELVHADVIRTCVVVETCIRQNDVAAVQVVMYREVDPTT